MKLKLWPGLSGLEQCRTCGYFLTIDMPRLAPATE